MRAPGSRSAPKGPVTQRGDSSIRRPPRGGFTLVELLVVIAVIVILAGLLFPVLAQAREKARQTVCLSHLRQIGQAHLLYLNDWDERFPNWWQKNPEPHGASGLYRFWPELFQPYLLSQELLRDPSFAWPPWPVPGRKLADYALFTWGSGGRGTDRVPYFCWAGPKLTLAQVVRPAETVTLTDGYTTTEQSYGLYLIRHQRGLNVAFVDGHAGWLPPRALRRLDTDGQGFYWLHYATADR